MSAAGEGHKESQDSSGENLDASSFQNVSASQQECRGDPRCSQGHLEDLVVSLLMGKCRTNMH
jgi:hypothetical protein